MQLEELEFHDHDSGWHLATTHFFEDLTLLVGVSGVGKTRILESIRALTLLADGVKLPNFSGMEWDLTFLLDHKRYRWNGAFQKLDGALDRDPGPGADDDESAPQPVIHREQLWENGATIVERGADEIRLLGKAMPKLSPHQSVLKTLSEERAIAPAHRGFKDVLFVDIDEADKSDGEIVRGFDKQIARYSTLDLIRKSQHRTSTKLALLYHVCPDVFRTVAQRFKDVFPQVEDVEIQRTARDSTHDSIRVRIKERSVAGWIPEESISSGMKRSLMHLARMALWPDGTVIVIDEFENSLGVNCIDFITQDMVDESRRLQFIITSHHPYIINNVSAAHWKIVSRDGSVVSTRDATDLGIERSSHQAFLKLLNLEQYQAGIAVE